MNEQEEWLMMAEECGKHAGHHWIPLAWMLHTHSKSITKLICTNCWHDISISDAIKYRIKL